MLLAACELAMAPRAPTRLEEIRRDAPDGYGTFTGIVHGRRPSDSAFCWTSDPVLSGVRVDLGIWHASAAVYRDTVTRLPPSIMAEPRFEVIGSTTTDAAGRFTFVGLPRRKPFAFRAIPPPDSPFQLAYGASLYGVGTVDTPNHPTLCLPTRGGAEPALAADGGLDAAARRRGMFGWSAGAAAGPRSRSAMR
jgi:hypothetical protein